MEDILIQMNKDASSPKFSNIRKAVKDALDILNDSIPIPTYQLRQLCLEPLKLSLESKNKKLSTGAVAGIQQLLQDERFVSQIESENENDWLPIQVLSTVFNTPNLSEDYQVEILKLLLRMSFSRDWCVNASIITKVSQVYVETYMASAHTVQGIIKATLTQLLSSFTDKIHNSLVSDSDVDDVMSDFNAKESADNDLMFQEVVAILKFFTNKLENSLNNKQYRQAVPLLLEGVQTLISSCPPEIRHFVPFQEILWKSLCPCLISLLGTPKSERSAFSPNASAEDIGRGSGCSLSAPNIHNSTAKTIYSISVGLVEKIGPVCSMHPVLESLFHRMLLYPPPEHRLDAIRAVKELLGAPKSLYNLACPTIGVENQSKNHLDSDISLLKIIVDSLKESCRSGESSLCTLSVTCMNELLNTLELCCKGTGITVPIGNAVKARDTLLKNALLKGESIEEKDLLDRKTSNTSIDYEAVERENANKFVSELNNLLPQLLQMTSSIEIDETLQEFASTFCSVCYDSTISNVDNNQETCDMAILNADGVYIATIYTLLLCLNTEDNVQGSSYIKKSLKEFQEDVLGSGLLLFVSPSWLEEVYSLVTSPRGFLKKNCVSSEHLPLMSLLKDIDGLGSHKKGGQLLAEYYENDDIQDEPEEARFKTEMGKLFAKRVLGKCWDGILEVCSVLLTEKTGGGISNSLGLLLGMEGAKEESIRAREAVCMSLESLQKSARLCCMLGLQQRCGSVFSILASTSCTLIESQTHSLPNDSTNKPKPMKIHASHVLSLDVVMTNGLEMGSHSADCWRHVFRCSAFISELEHTYFSKGDNQSNLPKLQQEQASVENIGEEDEMFGVEVGSVVPVAPGINIPELIRQSSIESGWERSLTGGGVLNHIQASKALCGLSQEVDRLFEEAAQKLNLKALVLFLSELCYSSHRQLGSMKRNTEENETFQLPNNALHIYRLQEVLMKVVNSNRPLIHIMRVWGAASSHLVEAAGHRERNVSKMAVTCVHDFIVAMLCNRPELPYFHVNELLCKTFENMLCLELCDGDVQDQIVCSICELVEACTADIKSGWRPLFGALRAVKIEYTTNEEVNEARQRHVAAVLDVFEVYLNTDNILVFANATVDCILCLLKYVRGPGEFEMDASDDDSISGNDFEIIAPGGQNLCIPALSYLRKCSDMLQKLWKMPACPVFNGAHRIKASSTQRVDSVLPLQDIKEFSLIFPADEYPEDTSDDDNDDDDEDDNKDIKNSKPKDKMKQEREFESLDFHGDFHNPNVVHLTEETDSINDFDQSKSKNLKNDEKNTLKETSSGDVENHCENTNGEPINLHQSISSESTKVSLLEGEVTLDNMDDNSGILHVWYLMIDGLSESVSSCLKTYQPDTLEMLFDLLRSVAITPGPRFALFCVNRVLLPMIQIWLRSGIRKIGYWQSDSTNFRQCCGMSTDLVVDFIQKFSGEPAELNLLKETMLKQLLDIMIECISQPVEVISRLGCSCIRHVVISSGKMFTETMWQISSDGISRAVDVTTHHIQQLMVLFQPNSENFYGDVGVVKVAMRHDCTLKDYQRVLHIATQVFLLDSQLTDHIPKFLNTKEPKAFSFLLYPPGCENCNNLDNIVARIPFQDIVVGLLSQQLLLQTIGTVLLGNDTDPKSYSKTTENLGMVPNMSTRNVLTLLKCLKNSNNVANMFDSRPGLKFLLQKVIGSDVAVNLYKQSGASMVLYINALLQICSRYTELSRKTVRQILAGSISSSINTHLEESSVLEPVSANRNIFLGLLHTVCNELCQIYVNMLSDDTLNRADKLAEQNVFFLIAQPDELSDLVPQRLGKKSSSGEGGVDQALDGLISLESVSQQEDVFASPEEHNELEDDPADFIAESNYSKQTKSKRERREEQNSKVYTLATDNLIKTLMTQYKKRKNYHSMPTFIKINKQPCPKAPPRKFSADEAIEKQHQSSIMKDSEARMMSLTELLCNILGLFQQLPDPKFEALLPLIFHCVNQLFYHAQEGKLKDALAQWLYKVGQIMQLSIN